MREEIVNRTNSQSYLKAVLAALPECVAIIDADLRIVDVNAAGLVMLGAKNIEDLKQADPLLLISDQYQSAFQRAFQAVLNGEECASDQPVRLELNALDGVLYQLECRFAPLADANGEIDAVVVTCRDITEWQQTVDAFEQSNSTLLSILATVPDPMVVIDERGHITSFSATAEKLFGYSQGELLGKNVNILMPAPHHEAHDSYIHHYLKTGEKHIIGIGRKVEGLRKDGTKFPMQLEVGEARFGDHSLFTGFIIDLTDKERTEAELQALQAELLHASRLTAVGTLASALAHEINQPLTAIANYLSAARDLLASGKKDNEELFREALQESVSESLRAGKIVRRLREFVSKGEMNRQMLSIAKVVNDATTLGLVGAYDKGISSSVEIAPDTNHVFVDRVQIQQVMINLMRNAIEAMADSPVKQLAISVRSVPDEQVEIAVSDTGSGIDPEMGDKIFSPFASTKSTGMGLGLSICRTIIEAHEGKLSVEDNPGGGTIFRIIIPKAEKEQLDAE